MNLSRLIFFVFTFSVPLACSISYAQLYDTPESRRQRVEAQKKAQEQKKDEADEKQTTKTRLEQKELEAKKYLGKTFWYLPNPLAWQRIRFFERIPPNSHSQDPNFLFTPLSITSFVVTGIITPPPRVFPLSESEYLLEIRFPEGKVGYVNVVGFGGIVENLYKGQLADNKEYVSEEPAAELLAREKALRETAAAKDEEKQAALAAIRRARIEAEARQDLVNAENARKEKAGALAARKRREAMPSPRIGMTVTQVIDQTTWGRPHAINRTTSARGVREQWVYGNSRYLYFENEVLTVIQD